MQRLIKEVNTMVSDEYALSAQKSGCINHSDYESFAVLVEAVDELHISTGNVAKEAENFWKSVKLAVPTSEKKQILKSLRSDAIMAACNAIQAAAMAYKALKTIENREAQK